MGKSKKKRKTYSSSSSSSSSSDESSKHQIKNQRKHKKKRKELKHLVSSSDSLKPASSVGRILPSDAIGPMLPSHAIGPILPSHAIGPMLPPHLVHKNEPKEDSDKAPDDLYKPANPPPASNTNQTIGPALPPHMLKSKIISGPSPPFDVGTYRPSLPPNLLPDYDCEDDEVGPLPEGMTGESSSHKALELRAVMLKNEMTHKKVPEEDGGQHRETWMLELPPESSVNLGLGPRTFRTKEGPDMSNRSEWTDTPADKAKEQTRLMIKGDPPENPKEERRRFLIAERDRSMEEKIEKCKKKKSLLETHQQKLKKEQKKKDKERGNKPAERRPFDRDVDLQVNRFDEAAKKQILNKARLLNSRFSAGESKFL